LIGALLLCGALALTAFMARERHNIVAAEDCQLASVPIVVNSRAPITHPAVFLGGPGLVDTVASRSVRVCRSPIDMWADADGDSSDWLISEDGAIVMICGGIGVLLLSLVVDWEALSPVTRPEMG
jgi:hypothetical protein